MKLHKRFLVLAFLGIILFLIIPSSAQLTEIHSDTMAILTEANDNEYLLVYKYDTIRNERVVNEEIRARTCKRTATEFQTRDIEETLVMDWRFRADHKFPKREDPPLTVTHVANKTALVFYEETAFLFLVAQNLTATDLELFLLYSEDNGAIWSDLIYLNITAEINIINFRWFDASILENEIFVAISDLSRTRLVFIDPDAKEISSEEDSLEYYGRDFELYDYDNKVYIVSTILPTQGLNATHISLTYIIGTSFYFQRANIQAPMQLSEYFNPSIVFWPKENQFLIIAQDKLIDVYDLTQGIFFEEDYLWGVMVSGTDDTTPEYIDVVKDRETVDGYYRREPSVSIYEEQIFVAFEVGEGRRFGGGFPEVGFGFSTNGETWTASYLGQFTIFNNPGIYFAVAAVGSFVIVLPSYYFYNRYRKRK